MARKYAAKNSTYSAGRPWNHRRLDGYPRMVDWSRKPLKDGVPTKPKTRASTGVSGRREKGQSNVWPSISGGEDEDRTHDLRIANAALSQLSYPPTKGAEYSKKGAQGKGGAACLWARQSSQMPIRIMGSDNHWPMLTT